MLLRCNGGNGGNGGNGENGENGGNGGNLQYGSVLMTLIMAVISRFI